MTAFKERVARLQAVLEENEICLDELRLICAQGIPDIGNLRPICWRILLDYIPLDRRRWKEFLRNQRKLYAGLVEDLVVRPGREAQRDKGVEDHPLNTSPVSAWNVFFKDNEVLLQIDKDVRRLCPEISFFQQATEHPCRAVTEEQHKGGGALTDRVANSFLQAQELRTTRCGAANLVCSRKVAAEEYKRLKSGNEAHWEVVERILFIYSKLNPGVKYVQGMNEIVGPIYYVFASASTGEEVSWTAGAEADAFFCFQNLMSLIKDNFIKTLDSSSCGIGELTCPPMTCPQLQRKNENEIKYR